MRRKILLALVALSLLVIAGCTDASIGKIKALGDPARVIQLSGGKEVASWCSTGKVQSEESSDGYYFVNRATKRPLEVSGDVQIDYGHPECQ